MIPVASLHVDEAIKKTKLLEQLESISLGKMYDASFRAVVRLHLFFTGRTQELLLEFGSQAQALILKKAGSDQVLDGSSGLAVQTKLIELWDKTMKAWREEFQSVRREAAAIPFGVLALMHERLVLPNVGKGISEAVKDGVFEPQLQQLLNTAAEHLYGDSLNLSARIWRLDRESRDGINQVLLKGIANRDSAWNVAQDLTQFLGANEDCPRWTSTRLYSRTKSQIAAGDVTGLLRGDECDGSGVAYNALRLARTEIQKIHALATDKLLMSQPWVTEERIKLSPSHGEEDICDEVVNGGEKGDGVYPVGTIELPLHPNCLCYKQAVLMAEKEFTASLRGWMQGTDEWPAMDDYADLLGGDVTQSVLPSAISLAVWLFSDELEKWVQ